MNDSLAFCPRCKKEVAFDDAGGVRKCTVCGLEFVSAEPPVLRTARAERVESAVMTVGHVLLRVFLIIGVIVLVGVAVLFASCAVILSGH